MAWKQTRQEVLDRDGHRCRVVERGARCPEHDGLHVHHRVPLSEIWESAAGSAVAFVRLATDAEMLLTVCARHNNVLDSARREARR